MCVFVVAVPPLSALLQDAHSKGHPEAVGACLQALHALLLEGGEYACITAVQAQSHVTLLQLLGGATLPHQPSSAGALTPLQRQRCLCMLKLLLERVPSLMTTFVRRRLYKPIVRVRYCSPAVKFFSKNNLFIFGYFDPVKLCFDDKNK